MENRNKIALVTGGSRGLGKDMALNLAKKGLNVILTYNSKKVRSFDNAESIFTLIFINITSNRKNVASYLRHIIDISSVVTSALW